MKPKLWALSDDDVTAGSLMVTDVPLSWRVVGEVVRVCVCGGGNGNSVLSAPFCREPKTSLNEFVN